MAEVLTFSTIFSTKGTDDIWKQWFGILKKRIHMEMEEPMFGIQMFTGSCRDYGTQMISRVDPTTPSSYSSQIMSDSYIVRRVSLRKFFQALKEKDKKNFLNFLFIKNIQPKLIFMRHLGMANITSLQCQYCIICCLLHLYSTL